ncbi:M56 family metallopeptidase [Candidatus Uabimicrobium sp. HlEnr_7]|uniref:M56 family metallopeptidase n=1 Tax=Candidatus Uabimicrobium helgolandensis TaxID=3095367 RepID=UPI0035568265
MEQVNELSNIIVDIIWMLSWQLVWLTVAALIFTSIFGRKSPRFAYALWFIVLLRFCIPIDFSTYTQNFEINSMAIFLSLGNPTPYTVSSTDVSQSLSLASYLVVFWIVCVTIISIIVIRRIAHIYQQLKKLTPIERQDIREWLVSYKRQLGIHKEIKIVHGQQPPSTVGFFRPQIILPSYMIESWTVEELEPILLHELSHIYRRDFLANLLQIALQIIYFFHPCMWYINKKIRLEREFICDDMAFYHLKKTQQKYVRSILKVLKNNSQQITFSPNITTGFFENSSVSRRIQRMLVPNYRSNHSSLRFVILASFLFLATLVCAQNEPTQKQENQIPVTINVNDVSIQEVAKILSKITTQQIVVANGIKAKISINMKKASLPQVLQKIAIKHNLHVRNTNSNEWMIEKFMTVNLKYQGLDVREAIKQIAEIANANIIISSDVQGKVDLETKELNWLSALKLVVSGCDSEVIQESNNVWRVAKIATITIDVKDADVRSVISNIESVSGHQILVARNIENRITMKLKSVSWLTALKAIAKLHNYNILKDNKTIYLTKNTKGRWIIDEEGTTIYK